MISDLLRIKIQNEELEYPKTNYIDIIRYYAALTKEQCEVKGFPDDLEITSSPAESLVVFDTSPEKNIGVYTSFPFSRYILCGIVVGDECVSFYDDVNSNPTELFEHVDKILQVSGNVEKKYQSKVISCQYDSLLKGYNYKFGKKNKNKKILVTTPSKGRGLLSQLSASTVWSKYAEQMGYIHFVDFQNFPNSYTCPKYLGKYNAWEYYFRQPSSKSIDEIYSSADVTIIRNDTSPPISIKLGKVDRSLLSERVLQKELDYCKDNFTNKTVLGVSLRGTDYFTEKWHRIPTDAHESLEICLMHMKKLGCDYVYLSTEDLDNYNYFKEVLGDRVIAQDRIRFNHDDLLTKVERSMDNFESLNVGMGYLIDTLMVSRTKAAIVSATSSVKYIKDFGDSLEYCDICLSKNYNGALGKNPLVIKSHNKNHLEFIPIANDKITCIKTKNGWSVTGDLVDNSPQIISESDVHLIPEKDYYFSVNPSSKIEGTVELILFDSKKKPFVIKEGTFTAPQGITLAQIEYIPANNGPISFEISCQIEVGQINTGYEPPYCSETQIGIMDTNGLIYKSFYVRMIDLHLGYFEANSKRIKFSASELHRANNVITYPGGFITYCINGQEYYSLNDLNYSLANNELQLFDLSIFDEPFVTKFLLMPHILNSIKSMLASGHPVLYELALIKIPKYCDDAGIIYLAKAFRDGNGVLKDLQLSAELLRLTSNDNTDAKNILFDVLWNIHTEKTLKEMIEIGKHLVDIGDSGGIIRMGKAYRSGVGVERDLDVALEYFRKAYELGSSWGKDVFVDLLKKIDTTESRKELSKIV